MAVLTERQVYELASRVGFAGSSLDVAVAIAHAESGFDDQATHHNTDGSTDRGLWQINTIHPQYSDACCYTPNCNASAAWAISSRGTNWQPWSTYTNGAYKQFLRVGSTPQPGGSAGPTIGGVAAWRAILVPGSVLISVWGDPRGAPIYRHMGEDLQATRGASIYAPEAGTVKNNYVDSIGGNAFLIAFDSGIWIYGAHLQARSPLKIGARINAGDFIGYVGNTGDAANTPPHLHYQVGYSGDWQDPRQVLSAWIPGIAIPPQTGPGGTNVPSVPLGFGNIGDKVHKTLVDVPGFAGIALAVDQAERFPGILPNNCTASLTNSCIKETTEQILGTLVGNAVALTVHLFIFSIGMLLVAGLVWNATRDATGGIATIAGALA